MRKCNRMYNHLALSDATGRVSPCCIYIHHNNKLEDFKIQNLQSFNSVLTSNAWQDLRKQIAIEDIPECENCWRYERAGNKSQRYWHNQNTVAHEVLEDLELSLDTTCNMMCRICRPGQSSKWHSAHTVVDKLDNLWPHGQYKTDYIDLSLKDHLRRVINNTDLSSLKVLRLNGGEPFYSKNLKYVLEKIDNDAGIENVSISFNTNGSIFPNDDTLKILTKAKRLQIEFSIDAIGDLASVIRYGVTWEDIHNTILKWKSLSNVDFAMFSVISLMNINHVESLYEYSKNIGKWSFYFLQGPDYLQVRQLPKHIRKQFLVNFEDKNLTDKINNMICNESESKPYFDIFLSAMHTMDQYQGNSFKQVNPEIYNLVNELLKH